MKKLQHEPHGSLKRLLLLLGVSVTVGVVLVACGGGNSRQSTEMATTTSATGNKEQALAVPPGWVGRPPAYEVINGITVPPEPGAMLNNSTLAGVDVNKNGVRDDVERVIATRWPTTFSEGMLVARYTQLLLTQQGSKIDPSLEKSAFCNVALSRVDGGILIPIILNTEDRQGAYQDNVGIVKTHGCN